MRQQRSRSQILFGFLPQQTSDLEGGSWKVQSWTGAKLSDVESTSLVRELMRQARPWSLKPDMDGGLSEALFRGRDVEVRILDPSSSVRVEAFPKIWMCRTCHRVRTSDQNKCKCGSWRWGQLPFVLFHDCGALREPFFKRCPEHNDAEIVLPGSSAASEIRIVCPICKKVLQTGPNAPNCSCPASNGFDRRMKFNVHRAAIVFTPRSIVVVNPPSRDQVRKLNEAGGDRRALSWVLGGLQERSPLQTPLTREIFSQQLRNQQMSEEDISALVELAIARGTVADSVPGAEPIPEGPQRDEAEAEARTIALALINSRLTVDDLIEGTEPFSVRGDLYRTHYRAEIHSAGLEGIELIDRFPVLTGNYGFTRGSSTPGESRLNPFRNSNTGNLVVYADIAETEALFVRFDPVSVLKWLRRRYPHIQSSADPLQARQNLLESCEVPAPGDDPNSEDPGTDLLKLLHSFSHVFIRRAATFSGIDRNALSELIVPLHLGFFVFAASRGDFVLGGLQAVFETQLHDFLQEVMRGDHRCPLDPGCRKSGGACMACLHVGEPSCRYFNRFLDRKVLRGPNGYLTMEPHITS